MAVKSIRFDISETQHNELKVHCARQGLSIRDYIISLIRTDWVGKDLPRVW
jgi:hypothetical protein